MGSGMLPAGAYVTLEHEFILILRKGNKRKFTTEEEKKRRRESSFFWEERNLWFSDVWEGLKGTRQNNINKNIRDRSGAYPFELTYRLINMFSLRGDTVLDPFLGTGTTTIASISTGRNSVGFEIDSKLEEHITSRLENIVNFSNKLLQNRIENHLKFVQQKTNAKARLRYMSSHYGFPVMTSQEREIVFDKLYRVKTESNIIEAEYKR